MPQIRAKRVKDLTWIGGEGFHKELCKKLKFNPTNKWCMQNPESVPAEWDAQDSLEFWYTNGSPNLGQMTKPSGGKNNNNNNKKTCWIVGFVVFF